MGKPPAGNAAIIRTMIVGVCITIILACIFYSIFLLPYSGKIADIIVGIVLGLAVLALKLVGIEPEDAERSQ
ncbi:hypothetical protein UNDKW_4197 [Undibacterium sp. KW1]|uniref:hypothetical protein n=1 Tax=Undibacterium sp. KW1 TaxID=2058624 RepID=UPI001331F482|nr:hypothetical protein [Undibacterium sp. KW1]BBB62470.1 hypothetical protein UNDKW_4197 [Undibacterium sp. KW1]